MLKINEYTNKNKDLVLEECLNELNLNVDDLLIRESETEAKLFKSKKIKLEVVSKKDIIDFIKDFINNINKSMDIDIKSEIKLEENAIKVLLISNNNSILIGKDGRTLNAIQTLLRQAIMVQTGFKVNVLVDVSNYKERQNYFFEREIKKVCKEVLKSHVDAKLDPMNSYKRRIVHNIVNEYENLSTCSEGEEPNRYVVIKYEEN